MLERIENLIYIPWKKYFFRASYQFLLEHEPDKDIYIFDIDNTLADTGKVLVSIGKYPGFFTYFNIYKTVERVKALSEIARNITAEKPVIFLSARSLWYFFVTYNWLKKNINEKISFRQVVLIRHPAEKIEYLKKINETFKHIHYYDDLSYNHENNEVRLYLDIIEQVKNIPLKYYGIEYINKI